jgi:hypothetical protein
LKKIYLFITFLLYSFMAFASTTTGIQQIDHNATIAESILTVTAKWGGVGLLVAAGVMFGLGKMKGEALGFAFYLLIGLGLISAGFGWWATGSGFGEGFSF